MSQRMHHVVSGEDLRGKGKSSKGEDEEARGSLSPMNEDRNEEADQRSSPDSKAPAPALVEPEIPPPQFGDPMEGVEHDDDHHKAPLRLIDGTPPPQHYHSSSSLSEDEDDEDDGDHLQFQHQQQPHSNSEHLVTLQEGAPLRNTMRRMARSSLRRMSSQGDASHSSSTNSQRAPSSQNSSRDWGWFFGDLHLDENGNPIPQSSEKGGNKGDIKSSGDEPSTNLTAPNYVLEESLSSQKLWKQSAGHRPPQPVEERAFYEKMWAQNFARSQVNYQMPVEVLTAASPISLNPFAEGNFDGGGNDYAAVAATTGGAPNKGDHKNDVAEGMLMYRMNEHHGDRTMAAATTVVNKKVRTEEGDLTVLVRGDNVFGTTVSKSFARSNENGDPIAGVDTINISVASYRVVESKKHGKYAQFLVIYREGSIRDTVGIWKRYSDFEELAHKVTHSHESCAAHFANISPLSVAEEPETEHLPNAITSWRLLKKRQRWYRCLDAGYLSLKVFLLERFLHDILFESSNPQLLRDFVGVSDDLL